MSACDVAIVGAGPYGLSAAAHLKAADGLDVRVFGEPMSFWERGAGGHSVIPRFVEFHLVIPE
jgi:2-polyprenyl-6-methoxyphenol hydroxylase-like FAD-dependent oxidoreductase